MVFSHKFFLLIFVTLAGIPMLADAQIIKRKSKSDFKAPVIYTLQNSSDTSVNTSIPSTIESDKDSKKIQKDSGQEAIIHVLSAIQKDVRSIKKNQSSGHARNREKNYSNPDSTVTIENYDYQQGKNYNARPDSAQRPYQSDSLKTNDAYQRKLDSLEQRIEILQKKSLEPTP